MLLVEEKENSRTWRIIGSVDRPLKSGEVIYLVSNNTFVKFNKDSPHIPFNGVLVEEVMYENPVGLLERIDNGLTLQNLNNICGN